MTGDVGARRVLVLDRTTMLAVAKEMRAWGRHYNQAVHAMNSINYYVAHGTIDREFIGTKAEEIEVELVTVNRNAERLAYELGQMQSLVLVADK